MKSSFTFNVFKDSAPILSLVLSVDKVHEGSPFHWLTTPPIPRFTARETLKPPFMLGWVPHCPWNKPTNERTPKMELGICDLKGSDWGAWEYLDDGWSEWEGK